MALSDLQIQTLARDAIQCAAAGDFAAAEPMLAQVAAARPNSGQALHLLGQARLKLRRFAEAREPLERAAKFLPRDPAPHVNLAGCLTMLGEHAAALAALDRAVRIKPGEVPILHNRGRALEALGRFDEARAAYDEALAIDHRFMPSLMARANLLAAQGDRMGALADLDMALTNRPDDAALKLRRAELLLEQGDWLRGLPDYEARLELPGDRYIPDLPRWQGEPLSGRLLIYPEQTDIDGDQAIRDTLMLARGVDAVVQCSPRIADWLAVPTTSRGNPLEGFAAAAPLRSLPYLLDWNPQALPPPVALRSKPEPGDGIGWFTSLELPAQRTIERDPGRIASCKLVVADDVWPAHLAAALGIPTVMLLGAGADWLWRSQRGPSPWYPHLELLNANDAEALAARLARC
ncbi:Flp pilus assembly protein TadD, contains TPR repeats [Enhydrobacter aerosaccus]|uniref:Flp pilus assembly protein TadD, contains TPR repeats n=1 Tax=Enhydrobacter aerosaccus TaxID=225324 RepID=A0A1T4PTV8_9HYPH|nr:tetratricopeptide repeat protein [Enhydrobacter aerosaccus]SJZ94980.1 Flp pilus assembly protein TadD, contains TPR repeats [Enhydrobacter aerosaccus]